MTQQESELKTTNNVPHILSEQFGFSPNNSREKYRNFLEFCSNDLRKGRSKYENLFELYELLHIKAGYRLMNNCKKKFIHDTSLTVLQESDKFNTIFDCLKKLYRSRLLYLLTSVGLKLYTTAVIGISVYYKDYRPSLIITPIGIGLFFTNIFIYRKYILKKDETRINVIIDVANNLRETFKLN